MYIAAVGAGFFASYLAVVQQIGEVSSGGFFLIFWMFQNPPDLFYSLIKGMAMATVIVLVGCYYGYNASGGPVGVGTATAKSMVLNTVMVHLIGMVGTQIFWGSNPRAADRWLRQQGGSSERGAERGPRDGPHAGSEDDGEPLDPRDWEGDARRDPAGAARGARLGRADAHSDEPAAPPTRGPGGHSRQHHRPDPRGEEPYQWHSAALASTVRRTRSSSST